MLFYCYKQQPRAKKEVEGDSPVKVTPFSKLLALALAIKTYNAMIPGIFEASL